MMKTHQLSSWHPGMALALMLDSWNNQILARTLSEKLWRGAIPGDPRKSW